MDSENFILEPNRWVPNNSKLPVIVHRRVLEEQAAGAAAARFEKLFDANDWPARWRDGIYGYHHYHSTAHEALAVAAGSARVTLGGPAGRELSVQPGDVVILPAGTGHCRIEATADFLVVGAYPAGQDWDICREAPTPAMRERIAHLPIPRCDPARGADGALTRLWR